MSHDYFTEEQDAWRAKYHAAGVFTVNAPMPDYGELAQVQCGGRTVSQLTDWLEFTNWCAQNHVVLGDIYPVDHAIHFAGLSYAVFFETRAAEIVFRDRLAFEHGWQ